MKDNILKFWEFLKSEYGVHEVGFYQGTPNERKEFYFNFTGHIKGKYFDLVIAKYDCDKKVTIVNGPTYGIKSLVNKHLKEFGIK